jgi:hypothetical protein
LSVISPTTDWLSPAEDKPADEGTFALHGGRVLTSKTPRQHKPCQPTEGNAISEQSSGVNSKAGLHFAAAVDDDDEEDEGGSTIIDSTSGPSRTCLCSQARMMTVSNPLTELARLAGLGVRLYRQAALLLIIYRRRYCCHHLWYCQPPHTSFSGGKCLPFALLLLLGLCTRFLHCWTTRCFLGRPWHCLLHSARFTPRLFS